MINRLLEEQGQQLSEALTGPYGSTTHSFPSIRSSPRVPAASPASASNRSLEGADSHLETQFLIPFGHSATLAWLLSLPPIRAVIGDFPKSYFYSLEEDTALPQPLDLIEPIQVDWPSLEPDRLRALAESYFQEASAYLPLFTREYYNQLQDVFIQNGPTQDTGTAICLCVWALGYMASNSTKAAVPQTLVDSSPDLGLQYFSIALRIILSKTIWGFTPNLQTCQALVLAASYFCYLGRPLHSWKMIHNAAHRFLEIIKRYVSLASKISRRRIVGKKK